MSPHSQFDLSSWRMYKASLLPKHKARQMAGGNKHQHGTSHHHNHGSVLLGHIPGCLDLNAGIDIPVCVLYSGYTWRGQISLGLFIFTAVIGDFIFHNSNHFKEIIFSVVPMRLFLCPFQVVIMLHFNEWNLRYMLQSLCFQKESIYYQLWNRCVSKGNMCYCIGTNMKSKTWIIFKFQTTNMLTYFPHTHRYLASFKVWIP